MIYCSLDNLKDYVPIFPEIREVLKILEKGNFSDGSYTTDLPNLNYNVSTYSPKEMSDDSFEYHRDNVDIQIMLEGEEKILYSLTPGDLTNIVFKEKDIAFLNSTAAEECILNKGSVAIYMQGELHKPGIRIKDITNKKVVFKVKK